MRLRAFRPGSTNQKRTIRRWERMANDFQDTIQELVNRAAKEGSKGLREAKRPGGALSGVRGVAAGAGVAALAPLAAKGIGKAIKSAGSDGLENLVGGLGDKLGGGLGQGNGPGGMITDALKGALPFGGGDGGGGGSSGAEQGHRPRRRQGTADARAAEHRHRRPDRDRLQPVDAVRAVAELHAPRHGRHPEERVLRRLLNQDLGQEEGVRGQNRDPASG